MYFNATEDELRDALNRIPKMVVAHMLWVRTDGRMGLNPGGFSTKLCEFIYELAIRADLENMRRLRRGFPDHVAAYEIIRIGEAERELAERWLREKGGW